MANYYALVASLRELSRESGGAKDFDASEIRGYVRENLEEEDRRLLDFFHSWHDIENIASVINQSEGFDPLGNWDMEQLRELIAEPERLPDYLRDVVEAYRSAGQNDDEAVDTSKPLARSLYEAFYRQAAGSPNRFMCEWFDFDRTLRNICAAVAARRAGRSVEEVLVGEDGVTAALTKSSAPDFGLKGEVEYIDTLLAALVEQDDLVEKERRIDALRWQMAEQLTQFDYFDMNAVLAYMARVDLVSRWQRLDPQTGRAMFEQLLDALSGSQLFEWIDKKDAERRTQQ